MKEKFENYLTKEPLEEKEEEEITFSEKEQERLRELRKIQLTRNFFDSEREEFLMLQKKENNSKSQKEVTEQEIERHKLLTHKDNLTTEEVREQTRLQEKIDNQRK